MKQQILLIKTGKLSPTQLIAMGKAAEDTEVWNAIFEQLDLTHMQLGEKIELGNAADSSDVWRRINRSINFALYEVHSLLFIRDLVNPSTWSSETLISVIRTGKLDDNQMIAAGKKGNWQVWQEIGSKMLLKKRHAAKLIRIGNRVNNPTFWASIIGTRKLNWKQMYEIGEKNKNFVGVWDAMINTGLLTLPQLILVQLADDRSEAFKAIVKKIKAENVGASCTNALINVGMQVAAWNFWNKLVDEIDFAEFEPARLMEIAAQADDYSVWAAVIATGKLSVPEMMKIGSQAKNYHAREEIIKTGKLTAEEVLQMAEEYNEAFVWYAAFETGLIPKEKMLEVCTRDLSAPNKNSIWSAAIQTGKLTSDEMIEIGNKCNNEYVWERINEQIAA